jgi:hypothetical protein
MKFLPFCLFLYLSLWAADSTSVDTTDHLPGKSVYLFPVDSTAVRDSATRTVPVYCDTVIHPLGNTIYFSLAQRSYIMDSTMVEIHLPYSYDSVFLRDMIEGVLTLHDGSQMTFGINTIIFSSVDTCPPATRLEFRLLDLEAKYLGNSHFSWQYGIKPDDLNSLLQNPGYWRLTPKN